VTEGYLQHISINRAGKKCRRVVAVVKGSIKKIVGQADANLDEEQAPHLLFGFVGEQKARSRVERP